MEAKASTSKIREANDAFGSETRSCPPCGWEGVLHEAKCEEPDHGEGVNWRCPECNRRIAAASMQLLDV